MSASLASHRKLADGYLLTAPMYAWYRNNYAPPGVARDDWRLSPLFADDLSHLSPAILLYSGFDPLRDEAAAYALKLTLAGVPVETLYFADMIHGFLTMGDTCCAGRSDPHPRCSGNFGGLTAGSRGDTQILGKALPAIAEWVCLLRDELGKDQNRRKWHRKASKDRGCAGFMGTGFGPAIDQKTGEIWHSGARWSHLQAADHFLVSVLARVAQFLYPGGGCYPYDSGSDGDSQDIPTEQWQGMAGDRHASDACLQLPVLRDADPHP